LVGQGIASVAGFLLVLARQTDRFSLRHIYLLGGIVAVGWIVVAVAAARKYRMVASRQLAPPPYKRWPTDTPVPPEVAASRRRRETSRAVTGTMSPADEDSDPVIERLFHARALRAVGSSKDVRWPPLADAWNHEWNRAIDEIATLIDATMGTARLSERLVRLRRLDGAEYRTAVDGLSPIIPQRYRESFLALLEQDEPFLLDRALKGYDAAQPPRLDRRGYPTALSPWTRSVIALSETADRDATWIADHENIGHMKRSELFSAFSLEYLDRLTRHAVRRTFVSGERIVTQDEAGDSLFVVTDGSVSIQNGAHVIARLGVGSCFGELSAILPERRSATVVAEGEVTTLVLARSEVIAFLSRHIAATQTLQTILRDRIVERLRDVGVGGGAEGERDIGIVAVEVTPERSARTLCGLDILADLSNHDIADLAVNVVYGDLPAGAAISPRSATDDALWIVVAGSATEMVGDLSVGTFGVGETVGTLPWLGITHYRMSIATVDGCRLARLSREVYEALVAGSSTLHIAVLSSLVTISRGLARVGFRT
ncbi:MAG: cyclic nucleotide-binding domain-containing protein, partial [Spirochaetales bacterium]|nr:cyclic nucleotide-binding domain-containing protein [Spirochaetales bacterium]